MIGHGSDKNCPPCMIQLKPELWMKAFDFSVLLLLFVSQEYVLPLYSAEAHHQSASDPKFKISNIKKFFSDYLQKKIMKKTPHLLIRLCLSCVVCLYWYNNEIEFTTNFMADNLSSVYGSPIYILVLNCNIESTEKSSDGYQQPNICRKKGKLWQFMFWLFTERT